MRIDKPLQVVYSNRRPFIKAVDMLLPPPDAAKQADFVQRALLTNAKDWEFEQEWRIIAERPHVIYKLASRCVVSVTIGRHLSVVDRQWLARTIAERSRPCDVHEASLDHSEFIIGRRRIERHIVKSWQ